MSKPIERRIAEMVECIDLENPPVTLDELNGMVKYQPLAAAPHKRSYGPAIALATAAGVLALGLVTLMIRDTTPGPPVSGVADGQTVSVTVSGVSGHVGDELAGVLYEGGELTDLHRDAVGGFWWVVSGDDDAETTEVVREPGDPGVGRFPYVSDEALTVEPGMYTLVLWVDDGLGPVSRWVPVNTDGRGLFGCQVVFEVGDGAQIDVVVTAGLQPDGWNINCVTGLAIPGTVSADPVTPSMPTSMPFVVGSWNSILASTQAGQAPPAATCPAGTDPNAVGPVDQPRPWGAAWSNQAAVFDQHAGRIIYIDEVGDTWTFDVCTNTWNQMTPSFAPDDFSYWPDRSGYSVELVYDVDSDRTIAFNEGFLTVYDANTNTWTHRFSPPGFGIVPPGWGAVYDQQSGLVVVQTSTGLAAYDVDTDTWTLITPIEDEYPPYLIGHITETDQLSFLGGFDDEGMLVDTRSGASADLRAPPDGGLFAAFGRLHYATSTNTPYVLNDGLCRLDPVTFEWTCISLADGPDSDGVGLLGAIVGDPINDRVVLMYGFGPGFDGNYFEVNGIWAIDFETGEWTQLLQQTGE